MTNTRVEEYYEMLRFFYLKQDSDWTDKAKSMRTIAEEFYKESHILTAHSPMRLKNFTNGASMTKCRRRLFS